MVQHNPSSNTQALDETSLLAMPESDYMNAAQLAFFRARLLAMRAELERNARTTEDVARTNIELVQGYKRLQNEF
jgi:DnaK suppressor protein